MVEKSNAAVLEQASSALNDIFGESFHAGSGRAALVLFGSSSYDRVTDSFVSIFEKALRRCGTEQPEDAVFKVPIRISTGLIAVDAKEFSRALDEHPEIKALLKRRVSTIIKAANMAL